MCCATARKIANWARGTRLAGMSGFGEEYRTG